MAISVVLAATLPDPPGRAAASHCTAGVPPAPANQDARHLAGDQAQFVRVRHMLPVQGLAGGAPAVQWGSRRNAPAARLSARAICELPGVVERVPGRAPRDEARRPREAVFADESESLAA